MVNARRLGRLGMLAVGLGMGAAVAATPGIASADSSTDWLSSIDSLLGGGALPALATPPSGLDLAISFDGTSLFQSGTAHATTTPGAFGFAFADGAGANASATGGFGDYASADGTNALATSGGSSGAYLDSATAIGAGANASATGGFGDYASATAGATALAGDPGAGTTGNNFFDVASAEGIGSSARAGDTPGFTFSDTTGSSFDYASAFSGNNTLAADGATAVAGFNGSGDSAIAVGQQVVAGAALTNFTGAHPFNNDSAFALGNLFAPTGVTQAEVDNGSGDTSFVLDPFGTVGSTAFSGGHVLDANPGNFDLAGVFGDALHASAFGSNMIDILPTLF